MTAYAYVAAVFDRYGGSILTVLAFLLLVAQTRWPLRRPTQDFRARLVTNLVVGLPGLAVLRLLMIPAFVALAMWNAQQWHLGVNALYSFPDWLEGAIAFVLLDGFIYVWHVLAHKVPLLWRFHLVHHTDLDLDLLTAFRFHAGELLLSLLFRGAAVVLTGASPLTVLVYEVVFEACTSFHHSNWRLAKGVERVLNWVIVTPPMHGVHHSIVPAERDSNWGTVFSFWDRLFGTFRRQPPQADIIIGEAPYQKLSELTAGHLLAMPFRRRRGQ